jgi:hypothetical protein
MCRCGSASDGNVCIEASITPVVFLLLLAASQSLAMLVGLNSRKSNVGMLQPNGQETRFPVGRPTKCGNDKGVGCAGMGEAGEGSSAQGEQEQEATRATRARAGGLSGRRVVG